MPTKTMSFSFMFLIVITYNQSATMFQISFVCTHKSSYRISHKSCTFFLHHNPRPQQTPKRPRITPRPIQHRIPHLPLPDILIVHIRDLKLTPPGDDHDVGDACCQEGVVDHRFIVDREQVLVRDFCQGVEAGACAACEDDAFHDFYLS